MNVIFLIKESWWSTEVAFKVKDGYNGYRIDQIEGSYDLTEVITTSPFYKEVSLKELPADLIECHSFRSISQYVERFFVLVNPKSPIDQPLRP